MTCPIHALPAYGCRHCSPIPPQEPQGLTVSVETILAELHKPCIAELDALRARAEAAEAEVERLRIALATEHVQTLGCSWCNTWGIPTMDDLRAHAYSCRRHPAVARAEAAEGELAAIATGTGIAAWEAEQDRRLADCAQRYGKGSEVYRLRAELLHSDRQRLGALRERNEVRVALERYGRHLEAMPGNGCCAVYSQGACDCGLDDVLRSA